MKQMVNMQSRPFILWQCGIRLVAMLGDITEQHVDVIVNSANTSMRIGGHRSVSGAIIRKTKGRILKALSKVVRPVPLGDIVVTDGAGLPCRLIFHVATHGSRDEESAYSDDDLTVRLETIGKAIGSILNQAEIRKMSSIAMPLLATGALGYPSRIIIEAMINALAECIKRNRNFSEIRLIVHEDYNIFRYLVQALQAKFADAEAMFEQERLIHINSQKIGHSLDLGDLKIDPADYDEKYERQDLQIVNSLASPAALVEGMNNAKIEDLLSQIRALQLENFNLKEQIRVLEESADLSGDKIHKMPLPVAFAISMVEAESEPVLRVENMRKAFSVLVKYLAVIGLAEYQAAGAFSEELNIGLGQIFKKDLTEGAWIKVAADIAKIFAGNVKPTIVSEYPSLWYNQKGRYADLYGAVDKMRLLRNEIHDNYIFDDTSAQKWLDRAEPLWSKIIANAEPLFSYKLVFIERLIDFSQTDSERTRYQVRWLTGEHYIPRAEKVEWISRLNKGRLFLKHPDQEKFLPLYPFLIYEHCQITRAREAFYIENVLADSVSFATFRFPYKWQDASYLKEVKVISSQRG